MSSSIQPKPDAERDDELEQLRQLLFDKQLDDIEILRKHLLDPKQRIEDTAEILVDSIKVAATDQKNFVAVINDPVDECIRKSVAQKPQEFADSLFPVMGPAIRKSISEALKSFVQSTNQMIEQSMSPKSLRWRWEAKRSGVPFSQIVLKYSLLYRVEEVFLIQQGSGLLIEHVSHPDVIEHDSDAISAMLTVIRDFTRDSFSTESSASDSLQTVEFGEKTLWIFDGPKALLACVNRGLVPKSNRIELQAVLEQFHSSYSTEIEQFSGDRSQNPEFKALLQTCLTQRIKHSETTPEGQSKINHWIRNPLLWLILLALLFGCYWLWSQYDEQRRTTAFLEELGSVNGIVVIGSEKQGDKLVIRGLRDPLAPELDGFASQYGFSRDQLQIEMALYQSLDSPIAIKRAARLLKAPDTVSLSVADDVLSVSGVASRHWLDFAVNLQDRIPGFRVVNFEHVKLDNASLLQLVRQELKAPARVKLRLEDQTLFVTGVAPLIWIQNINHHPVLKTYGLKLKTRDLTRQLQSEELLHAQELMQMLNGVMLYFSHGVAADDSELVGFYAKLVKVKQLVKLLDTLNIKARFVVKAFVDGVGSENRNLALRFKRADFVKQGLVQSGVSASLIAIDKSQPMINYGQVDLALRRADLEIIAEFDPSAL